MLQKLVVLWIAGVVGFNATGEAIDPGAPCQLPEPPMIHNIYAGDMKSCQLDLARLADNHVIKFWEGPDFSDVIPIINYYKEQGLFLTLHFAEVKHIDYELLRSIRSLYQIDFNNDDVEWSYRIDPEGIWIEIYG